MAPRASWPSVLMDIGGPPLPAAMTWQAAAWRHKGEDCDDKRYGKKYGWNSRYAFSIK